MPFPQLPLLFVKVLLQLFSFSTVEQTSRRIEDQSSNGSGTYACHATKFDLEVMEQEEKQQFPSPLPVLPRLDRLDRLLEYLEEKHSLSGRHTSSPAVQKLEAVPEDPSCKALSSALEEVHHKGTLMERIEMLEGRVLQLSLEMDERNTSKSSSSTTIPVTEEVAQLDSGSSSIRKLDGDVIITTLQEKKEHLMIQKEADVDQAEMCLSKPQCCSNSRGRPEKVVRKWRIKCFQMGC